MGHAFKARLRPLAGASTGLALYWLFVVVKGIGHFVQWRYYDWEHVRGECIFPFISPILLSPHTWREYPLWVNAEMLFSVLLIAAGALLFTFRVRPHRK